MINGFVFICLFFFLLIATTFYVVYTVWWLWIFLFIVDAVISGLKPYICPAPWKGLNGICDRRADSCTKNEDCKEDGGKCCFNGCQKDCVQFGMSNECRFHLIGLRGKCFSERWKDCQIIPHEQCQLQILTIKSCKRFRFPQLGHANLYLAIEWPKINK